MKNEYSTITGIDNEVSGLLKEITEKLGIEMAFRAEGAVLDVFIKTDEPRKIYFVAQKEK